MKRNRIFTAILAALLAATTVLLCSCGTAISGITGTTENTSGSDETANGTAGSGDTAAGELPPEPGTGDFPGGPGGNPGGQPGGTLARESFANKVSSRGGAFLRERRSGTAAFPVIFVIKRGLLPQKRCRTLKKCRSGSRHFRRGPDRACLSSFFHTLPWQSGGYEPPDCRNAAPGNTENTAKHGKSFPPPPVPRSAVSGQIISLIVRSARFFRRNAVLTEISRISAHVSTVLPRI